MSTDRGASWRGQHGVSRQHHLEDDQKKGRTNQVTALLSLLPGSNSRAANSLRDLKGDELAVRRLLCGFVCRGPAGEHESGEAKSTVKELIVRGLKVLCSAVRLESGLRAEVEQQIRDHSLLRKVMKAWLQVVLKGSPLRVAAQRQLRIIRVAALEICRSCTANGTMAEGIQSQVLGHVKRRVVMAREEADKFYPDLGEEAIWWWFIQSRGWVTINWSKRKRLRKQCAAPQAALLHASLGSFDACRRLGSGRAQSQLRRSALRCSAPPLAGRA